MRIKLLQLTLYYESNYVSKFYPLKVAGRGSEAQCQGVEILIFLLGALTLQLQSYLIRILTHSKWFTTTSEWKLFRLDKMAVKEFEILLI